MIVETTAGCRRTPVLLFALEERGAPYTVELRPAGWFLEHHGGPGPVLVDGELVLPELDAVIRHVCRGTPLLPDDEADRARVERWMELCASRLRPALARLAAARAGGDPARAREEAGNVERCLATLEQGLAATGHLVGGALTVADLPLVQLVDLPALGVDLAPCPRLRALAEELRARPAWRRANEAMGPRPAARRHEDRLGNTLTTSSAEAAGHYVDALDRIVGLDEGVGEAIGRAIAADEGLAAAHALAAVQALFELRPADAVPALLRARALVEAASDQERGQVALVGRFLARDPGLLPAVDDHLSRYPRDLLAILAGMFSLTFGSGRLDRNEVSAAWAARVAAPFEGDWALQSARALVEEEAFAIGAAERLAEQALLQNPRAGFAIHALAHVGWERQDHVATADRLEAFVARIGPKAPFRCHFAWHAALSSLAGGDLQRARGLYDREIDPRVGHPRALVDASSFGWRLRLAGAPEPDWAPIAALAAANRPGFPMADTWTAVALAGAGDLDGLDRHARAVEQLALQGGGVAALAVLPLVEGLRACVGGRWSEAADRLAQADHHKVRVGMSNAQGELVEDLYVRACRHAGRAADADARLATRAARRTAALSA